MLSGPTGGGASYPEMGAARLKSSLVIAAYAVAMKGRSSRCVAGCDPGYEEARAFYPKAGPDELKSNG